MNFYPSILTDSLDLAQKQVNLVKDNPHIKTLQVDIIDGFFTDNLTVTPMDLVDINFHNLQIDFHLMVEEPLAFIEEIINYKDHLPIRAVISQVEKMTSQEDCLELLEKYNLKAGFSLDLFTPLEEILNSNFKKLDVLQIMTIQAGEQGRDFETGTLAKITEVKKRAQSTNSKLEIIADGGIKIHNLKSALNAGANGVCVGSALWESDSINQEIKEFFKNAR